MYTDRWPIRMLSGIACSIYGLVIGCLAFSGNLLLQEAVAKEIKLPEEQRTISSDDLRFGEQQVDAMLKDRPQMKGIVNRGDVVYEWAARRFGGVACGERIWWNPGDLDRKPPRYTSEARYPGTSGNREGSIRVRCYDQYGKPHPGQFLWAKAVFELFNVGSGRKFHKIYEDMLERDMTKEEFIDRATGIEYENNLQQHAFYQNVWVPFLTQKRIEPESSGWWTRIPTLEQWKASWRRDSYPYDTWGVYYDQRKPRCDEYRRKMQQWNALHPTQKDR